MPLANWVESGGQGTAREWNTVMLKRVLTALASGRSVVVSRGELVEIGGGFRVPDVMAQSGAVLREVGTTNKLSMEIHKC